MNSASPKGYPLAESVALEFRDFVPKSDVSRAREKVVFAADTCIDHTRGSEQTERQNIYLSDSLESYSEVALLFYDIKEACFQNTIAALCVSSSKTYAVLYTLSLILEIFERQGYPRTNSCEICE